MKMQTAAAFAAMLTVSIAGADPISIADVMQSSIERGELAGIVTAVVSKDRSLSLEARGYADIATQRKMQPDTVFWIASISKPIAAVAVMMLVDEGKIRLDEPVSKYLPQFAPRIMSVAADGSGVQIGEPRTPIIVRHLLSHTSGLVATSSIERPTLDLHPLSTRVQSYSLGLLDFEPGSDYQYSNAGINTAGRIVELVSGMSYEEFLQTRLFDPLGMKDTGFWPTEAQSHRLAKAYWASATSKALEETPINQLRYPLTERAQRYAMPAGGLFSTARDLGKFCQMLLNGGTVAGRRYLSREALAVMTRTQLDPKRQPGAAEMAKIGRGYGLGWLTGDAGTYAHGGAYLTLMTVDPKHGIASIWLTQRAGGDASVHEAFKQAVARQFIASHP